MKSKLYMFGERTLKIVDIQNDVFVFWDNHGNIEYIRNKRFHYFLKCGKAKAI